MALPYNLEDAATKYTLVEEMRQSLKGLFLRSMTGEELVKL